jgi:metal-responsive CopG/Arc/MetJ family transcriptional regulator
MKTAVSLPDPLFAAADELARRLQVSRSELYARAIERYVKAHRQDRVTQALNRVYASEDSALDPALARLQARSLPHEKW